MQRDVDKGQQSRVLPFVQATASDNDAGHEIEVGATAWPEAGDRALIGCAVAIGLGIHRANAFDLVVVTREYLLEQIERCISGTTLRFIASLLGFRGFAAGEG